MIVYADMMGREIPRRQGQVKTRTSISVSSPWLPQNKGSASTKDADRLYKGPISAAATPRILLEQTWIIQLTSVDHPLEPLHNRLAHPSSRLSELLVVRVRHRDRLEEERCSRMREVDRHCEAVSGVPKSRERWGHWRWRNPEGGKGYESLGGQKLE